jgi:hypothetical protein
MNRIPCGNCGATVLPATFERTEGLCMPCKQAQRLPIVAHAKDLDGFTIAYTERPSWGRSQRVYLLDADDLGHFIIFQSADALPNDPTHRSFKPHQIYSTYPNQQERLSPQSWATLRGYVDSLTVPILGDFTGGLDGTHYYLRIDRSMTSVEFHWWMDLPDRWSCLTNIIEMLTGPFTKSIP